MFLFVAILFRKQHPMSKANPLYLAGQLADATDALRLDNNTNRVRRRRLIRQRAYWLNLLEKAVIEMGVIHGRSPRP